MKLFSRLVLFFVNSSLGTPAFEQLMNAGAVLAQAPLDNNIQDNVVTEIKPSHFDLAISRLQSKVEEVIDGVWMELNDKVNIFTKKVFTNCKQEDHISNYFQICN